MKSLEKDIILICKGHYDDKYKNEFEALNTYYHKHYSGYEDKHINYKFALELFIRPTIEFLLKEDKIRSFIYNGLFDEAYQEKRFLNEDGCTEFNEVLYHRMVKWICLLQIKENDEWFIDLSDYNMEGDII